MARPMMVSVDGDGGNAWVMGGEFAWKWLTLG